MAEYNAKLHVKTNTGYDDINLQTKSEIVDFNKSGTDLSSTNVENAIKEINDKSNENKNSIGTLSSLLTSAKTNLVSAVNEIYNNFIKKIDIINNLVSTDTDKPLSANMGKQLKSDIDSVDSKLTTVRTLSPWTLIEYPNNLVEMWRYATISATDKTNTFSLPTPLKDNQFGVKAFPVFNGHLCRSLWCGTKTGGDGRTTTTVQISMDSTDSSSNVGIMIFITGYKS